METFVVKDGTTIFYKDWGAKNSQPLFFHHGWPLSADDWDSQMMFFLEHGFRVDPLTTVEAMGAQHKRLSVRADLAEARKGRNA